MALALVMAQGGESLATSVFANDQITVQGVVWYDDNRNDLLDPGEEAVLGATIEVEAIPVRYLSTVATTTSGIGGRFQVSFPQDAGRYPTLVASALRPGYPYAFIPPQLPNEIVIPVNYRGHAAIPLDKGANVTVNLPLSPEAPGVLLRLPPGAAPDFPILDGHFFTETNGYFGWSAVGFAVTNHGGVPFWDTWQRLGLENVGYPLSQRFAWAGFVTQVFQKAVLQWRPDLGTVAFVNVFDELHNRKADPWLLAERATPLQIDSGFDAGKSWDETVRGRLALLDANPAIKARYFAAPDPLLQYGLPTSRVEAFGNVLALRTQRTVLQQWKVDVPWAKAGEVTVANGGEMAKGLVFFPSIPPYPDQFMPQPPP